MVNVIENGRDFALKCYICQHKHILEERSSSVVECLTQDQMVAGSSLTGGTVLCP